MEENRWLDWAIKPQSLAQAGLPLGTVKGLFCNETGYQTPRLGTRAA